MASPVFNTVDASNGRVVGSIPIHLRHSSFIWLDIYPLAFARYPNIGEKPHEPTATNVFTE